MAKSIFYPETRRAMEKHSNGFLESLMFIVSPVGVVDAHSGIFFSSGMNVPSLSITWSAVNNYTRRREGASLLSTRLCAASRGNRDMGNVYFL